MIYFLSGPIRTKVYIFLTTIDSYAYEIAKVNNLNITSVRRILNEFQEKKIVKSLNGNGRNRKFFSLTSEAQFLEEEVRKRIKIKQVPF